MTPKDTMRAAVEALTAMCQNFPTDSDMTEAGWATHEINAACDAYDKGQAALSLLRSALEEGGEPKPLSQEDRAIMEAVHRELDREGPSGDAPGHCHERPGIWDSDNGARAGMPCAWCLTWRKFTALIAASPIAADTQGDAKRTLPAFIRRRVEQAIHASANPQGMSVNDGTARIHGADLSYMLKLIDVLSPSLNEQGDAKEGDGGAAGVDLPDGGQR